MKPYSPEPSWDLQQPSKRTITFIHPVKDKVMFAPDSIGCSTIDTLYLFNDQEIL